MARLTSQMLAYSGRGRYSGTGRPLHQVIRSSADQASFRTVEFRLALDNNLPAIEADASQLQQVIMNMVINAAEAIDTGRGMVEVRMARSTAELRANVTRQAPAPGECRQASGQRSWLDPAAQARIFDPFFTASSQAADWDSRRCWVSCADTGTPDGRQPPGRGTTFRFFRRGRTASRGFGIAARRGTGNGTVLVVDDDDLVRTTARSHCQGRLSIVLARRP